MGKVGKVAAPTESVATAGARIFDHGIPTFILCPRTVYTLAAPTPSEPKMTV